MFQDIHVMMFIGFGYLMTFMLKYQYSAVAYNMFLTMITIESAILVRGISTNIEHNDNLNAYFQIFRIDITDLIDADFAAAAVLITMGGVLGKLTHTQMFFMCIIEVVVY